VLILRIKQAEHALADGRLDEAFELVVSRDLRSHRSGQDLVNELVAALVKRGREHLGAGRLVEAGADCEKAERLGGMGADVAMLRNAVREAMSARNNEQRRKAELLAAARGQIERGQLTVGQKLLDELGQTEPHAAPLAHEVAARRAAIESLLSRTQSALRRDDWQAAIDELTRAERCCLADARVREVVGRIAEELLPQIRTAIDGGRLDFAHGMLERLERVDGQDIEAQQLRQTLRQCKGVWDALSGGRLREAEEMARRLTPRLPKANWLSSAIARLKEAVAAMDELRSGPLSLLGEQALAQTVAYGATPQPVVPTPRPKHPAAAMPAEFLPERFTLQVDGVGSFRVLRGRRVAIGPVSSSRHPDLALLADATVPGVVIERTEDDYFLRSEGGAAHAVVAVNDKPTNAKMLRGGDRIALSARCRLTFALPVAASTTAVLHLASGARLSRSDLRTVVLFDRELIIGPGPGSHVRCDQLTRPIVLLVREGKLVCQSPEPVFLDGQQAGRSAEVPMNTHITAGPVGFVVTQE
jgi:hypothetical protein